MAGSNRYTDTGAIEHDEDEAKKDPARAGARRKFAEFDCPTCSANNPQDDFGNGDEVICGYCGLGFLVKVTNEGELKLREL
jgi:hypothetical protein